MLPSSGKGIKIMKYVYSVMSISFSRLGIYLMTEAKPSLEMCVNKRRNNGKKSQYMWQFPILLIEQVRKNGISKWKL
jgi:hypothetical protein